MVVPIKLTQFYGHKVPRPRIYPDVKFNDQRVDPPASVNEALLSWAADAHWSMGGLSFKRIRSQGTVEGNVRRLRAMIEDDENKDSTEGKRSPLRKLASKSDVAVSFKPEARKPSVTSGEEASEDSESVEATPARRLRSNGLHGEDNNQMELFIPATEERVPRSVEVKSRSRLEHSRSRGRITKERRSPSSEIAGVETPASVPATVDMNRKSESVTKSAKSVKGNAGETAMPQSRGSSDRGRVTRSSKNSSDQENSFRSQDASKVSRAKKALLVSESELNGKNEEASRKPSLPLRRSGRSVKPDQA